MLLTLTTTHPPATDLGYLLHKHPDRVHVQALAFATAHVYYPEASPERCTAALLLDVDPIALARQFKGETRLLARYVNDRPFVASSFLSVAIAQVFSSALGGQSRERPALAATELPLTVQLPVLPSRRGGEALLKRLFEPLGYQLTVTPHPLDDALALGDSPYYAVTLSHRLTLQTLLRHLYVLIPVLDREKHYWVGEDEVAKLLRHGETWLAHHPERALIAQRYLKYRPALTRLALAQLLAAEGVLEDEEGREEDGKGTDPGPGRGQPAPPSLHERRLDQVAALLVASGARRVLDLGCGEGKLLQRLLAEGQFRQIKGVDVASGALEIAARRLKLERLPEAQRQRIELCQGSLLYRDSRLRGFDAAAVVEVIEHLEPERLEAFARHLFGDAQPPTVIVTTPNADYNVHYPDLRGQGPQGGLRHPDHRFEWGRQAFARWAATTAKCYGYDVTFHPVGDEHPTTGAPGQLAHFQRQRVWANP